MPSGVLSHHTDIAIGYKDQIREIIWGLVIQGIVVPGGSNSQPDLPFMQISEWGKKCLESGEYLPYDAGQYLARMKTRIQGVDSKILLYLQESLTAFRSGAYVASAVMTGVAAKELCSSYVMRWKQHFLPRTQRTNSRPRQRASSSGKCSMRCGSASIQFTINWQPISIKKMSVLNCP